MMTSHISAELVARAGFVEKLRPGLEELEWLVSVGTNLRKLGLAMAWLVIIVEYEGSCSGKLSALMAVLEGLVAGNGAVQRASNRSSFPLPLGGLEVMVSTLASFSKGNLLVEENVQRWAEEAWLFLSIVFLNRLHSCRALSFGSWRKMHQIPVSSLKLTIQRALAQDTDVPRTVSEVEKELSGRFLSYSGEEVPKMEVLTVSQVLPALPPEGHGGCIDAVSWVRGRTHIFLKNPWDCVLPETEVPMDAKLKAKVHVVESDKLALAELLVSRGVCTWTKREKVFRYRGQMVLNGLFGVAKSTILPSGLPTLRVIMNLIPSNGVLCQLRGLVGELPGICQYMSIFLGPEEENANLSK